MFEIFRQDFLGECVLIDHDKPDPIGCPFDDMLVLMILSGVGVTLSSS